MIRYYRNMYEYEKEILLLKNNGYTKIEIGENWVLQRKKPITSLADIIANSLNLKRK